MGEMADLDKDEFWKALNGMREAMREANEESIARDKRLAERQEALAQSVELLMHEVNSVNSAIQKDAENIRTLARIAEMHERRLTSLEGGENP